MKPFENLKFTMALSCATLLLTACGGDDESVADVSAYATIEAGSTALPARVRWSADVTDVQKSMITQMLDRMVYVAGGTFYMGAQSADAAAINYLPTAIAIQNPVHAVQLSPFYISRFEVTQQEWYALMQQRPTSSGSAWNENIGVGDLLPAYFISYDDASALVQRLTAMTGLAFSIPTEAQWEYAARGGREVLQTRFAGSGDAKTVAWYAANSGKGVHVVGAKAPNELGLYDMSGNVWEWCQDWFARYEAGDVPAVDPVRSDSALYRVMRGGSWFGTETDCDVTGRMSFESDDRSSIYGLRLVVTE